MPPKKKTETGSNILSIIENLESKYPQSTDRAKTPTGCLPVDFVLKGGFKAPAFIELAGESQTGKTTMALTIAKTLIKKGHRVIYLNFEQAPLQFILHTMGMDSYDKTQFVVYTPFTIGEGEEILGKLVYCTPIGDEPYFDHVFFDSVGGMIPDYLDDDDKDSTDNTPAVRARQLAKFFEVNTAKLKRRGVSCWFVNHLSLKIETEYGKVSKKKSKGGVAVEYWCDDRLFLESGETLKAKSHDNATGTKAGENEFYANIGRLTHAKARIGGMLRKTDCPVFFGKGVSNSYWLYLVLKNNGYTSVNGSYIKCTLLDEKGVNLQGVQGICKYLTENSKAVISEMKKQGIWNFLDDDEEPEGEA